LTLHTAIHIIGVELVDVVLVFIVLTSWLKALI
jgi:hypothetical protein